MHYELLLHASVPAHRHSQILQVLAGVSAQPPAQRPLRRRCYIFVPTRTPPGASGGAGGGGGAGAGGGSRGQPQNQGGGSQEIAVSGKRQVRDTGQACVLQLVHEQTGEDERENDGHGTQGNLQQQQQQEEDHIMIDDDDDDNDDDKDRDIKKDEKKEKTPDAQAPSNKDKGTNSGVWRLHYYEIPEPGKKSVTSRQAQTTDILTGDAIKFVEGMGYSCTTQYVTEGQMFVHHNIVLHLHRILHMPFSNPSLLPVESLPEAHLSSPPVPLDSNDGYLLEAKITLADGGQPDLVQQGTQELVRFRDSMKGCLDMRAADRLSMDTRVMAR